MAEFPRAIDVLTATDEDLVAHAVDWLRAMEDDEQKAAEQYGNFATLMEEAAKKFPVTREGIVTDTALTQLLRDTAITIGTLQTDELKHQSALVRLRGEFDRHRKSRVGGVP